MGYYQHHLLFCTNHRAEGKKCCQQGDAEAMCHFAKLTIKKLGLAGAGKIRVSSAGCLGRCKQGPVLVIYPQQLWYTYASSADVAEIIEQQLLNNKPVERLLLTEVG